MKKVVKKNFTTIRKSLKGGSEPTVTLHPTGDKRGEPVANRFVQIIRGSLGVSPWDASPVSSVERAPVC